MPTESPPHACDTGLPKVSRRVVIAGARAVGVAAARGGCSTYGDSTETTDPPAKDPAPGAALAQTADIPVGGGKVFPDQQVVVTPARGGHVQKLHVNVHTPGLPSGRSEG